LLVMNQYAVLGNFVISEPNYKLVSIIFIVPTLSVTDCQERNARSSEDGRWIELAQDRVQGQLLVIRELNLWVLQPQRRFCVSWTDGRLEKDGIPQAG
jgi:hypothetical protein